MILRVLPIAVTAMVVIAYLSYNLFFAVNFPFQDDFLLIQFIEVVSNRTLSYNEFFTELFRTFNDHKAAIPRLIALVDYWLSGELNFRFYIAIVLFNIVYIFSFVAVQFRKMGLSLIYFLPAPFLFFHPLFHEVSGWALNGMQHTFLTAFTVTAILLVSSGRSGALFWALVCCFLATFTHGNGILSFPAIVFYFLCVKDLRKAAITTLLMFVCLGIYLMGYESGQARDFPKNLMPFITYFLAFIGSGMSLWAYSQWLSAGWGLVITAFMVWITFKAARTYFKQPTRLNPGTVELLTLFAFILTTSLVVALFRSWTGGAIASRFQIYTALATVIFYVLLVDQIPFFRKKVILVAVTGLSIIYWAYSYYQFTGIVSAKKATYLADVYNWSTNRDMFSVEKSIVRNAGFYLDPAYRKGFFHLPPAIADKKSLDSMFVSTRPAGDFQTFIETWMIERAVVGGTQTLDLYFITSHHAPRPMHILANRFLVLRSQKTNRIHLMCANPKIQGRRKLLSGSPYYKAGFNAQVRRDDLSVDVYELGLLDVENSGQKTFYNLTSLLEVDGDSIFIR